MGPLAAVSEEGQLRDRERAREKVPELVAQLELTVQQGVQRQVQAQEQVDQLVVPQHPHRTCRHRQLLVVVGVVQEGHHLLHHPLHPSPLLKHPHKVHVDQRCREEPQHPALRLHPLTPRQPHRHLHHPLHFPLVPSCSCSCG